MKAEKELRDFIKSHEMRYYVANNGEDVRIKNVFKVDIDGGNERWVRYDQWGFHPLSQKDFENATFKTKEDAKARAEQLRTKFKEKIKAKKAEQEAKRAAATAFLKSLYRFDYVGFNSDEVRPEYKELIEAVEVIHRNIPKSKQEEDYKTEYIALLERYVKYGTIETQGIAFRREHVVSVKYAKHDAVKIELVNGTTIIPKSQAVTQLIKTLFGGKNSWYFIDIKSPEGETDIMKEYRRPL